MAVCMYDATEPPGPCVSALLELDADIIFAERS